MLNFKWCVGNEYYNMFLRKWVREQSLVFTFSMLESAPSKELRDPLQGINYCKNEKVQLDSFKTTEGLFEYLDK